MKLNITKSLLSLSSHYVSSKIVLTMDLCLSVFASFSVSVIGGLFQRDDIFNPSFIAIYLPVALLWSYVSFISIRTHKRVIRHTSANDVSYFALASLLKGEFTSGTIALIGLLTPWIGDSPDFWLLGILDAVITLVFMVAARVFLIVAYQTITDSLKDVHNRVNVLVFGISESSVSLIKRLRNSRQYKIAGFISTTLSGNGLSLEGIPAFFVDSPESLDKTRGQSSADMILFPEKSMVNEEKNGVVKYAVEAGMKVLVASDAVKLVNGDSPELPIREIKISDLLGRKEIQISMEKIKNFVAGKTIMVTGAAGSIGSELCRQLAGFGVEKLILFDNAETPMHNLRFEFDDEYPDVRYVSVIGDVRNSRRVDYAFRKWKPQIVFHAAAYKHVPLMEENPCESVRLNLGGTRIVADKCIEYNVEKMVMVSTDKAVNPSNVMGCTKRLAEMYVQSLGLALDKGIKTGKTKFVTTRFGNVLNSNGSVIPRFTAQIEKGGPVTVTHPEINRFFMTIPEACRLVLEAVTMSRGNNIFVFDMGDPIKIDDLARNMIMLAGLKPGKDIQIVYTGLRPGEKLYEEVLANEENTYPSSHKRIKIAKVRDLDYDSLVPRFDALMSSAQEIDVEGTVRQMKELVPEFVSNNSEFSAYDKC